MPAQTIMGWARSGHLYRIHESVYSIVPPAMLTQEGRWLAAVKACGHSAAVSHGPAGQILGLVPRSEKLALHVSVSDRRRVRVPGIVIHRPRSLPTRDLVTRLGIPVTSVTRTIWDIASSLPAQPVRRAVQKQRAGTGSIVNAFGS